MTHFTVEETKAPKDYKTFQKANLCLLRLVVLLLNRE